MNAVRIIFLYLKIVERHKENTDNLKTVRMELLKGMFLLIYKLFVKQYHVGPCVIICLSQAAQFPEVNMPSFGPTLTESRENYTLNSSSHFSNFPYLWTFPQYCQSYS